MRHRAAGRALRQFAGEHPATDFGPLVDVNGAINLQISNAQLIHDGSIFLQKPDGGWNGQPNLTLITCRFMTTSTSTPESILTGDCDSGIKVIFIGCTNFWEVPYTNAEYTTP